MSKKDIKNLYWSLLIARFGAGLACIVAKFYLASFAWFLLVIVTVGKLIHWYKQ